MAQQWLGACRMREVGSDREFSCLAAIWAGSYHECSVLLGRHIRASGHSLLKMEGFHPEDDDTLSRTGVEALTLARQVGPAQPVVLGALAPAGCDASEAMSHNGLIEMLSPVQPLQRTDPAWQGGDLPAPLMDILFAPPLHPADDEGHEGDTDLTRPLQTYAVLDAAKFGTGANEIERCNMPVRSLFTGKAAQDLADIAPYIVQLDPHERFTRCLFRHDPYLPAEMTSIHIWHREPGIFIRTRLGLDALWRHFRRFTRVRDAEGGWFVLRFYDPNVVLDMAEHLEEDNRRRFFTPDIEVIAFRKDGTGYRIRG